MGIGKYQIKVFDYTGVIRFELFDFKSLYISEDLNDVGSWKITSHSLEKCPFNQDDGIVVYRNGIQIFCGILSKIDEEYDFATKSWAWTASGTGFNVMLKWRFIRPDPTQFEMRYRYRSFQNSAIGAIIFSLISDVRYTTIYGIPILGSCMNFSRSPKDNNENTIKYRYENLFEIVTGLANNFGYTIVPLYRESSSVYTELSQKITVFVTPQRDLSDTVVYRDFTDGILSFRHISIAPENDTVLMSYNSPEDVYWQDIWKYDTSLVYPSDTWRAYNHRYNFVKPNKDDFEEQFLYSKLDTLCSKEAEKYYIASEGYEIEIDTRKDLYSYGFRWDEEGAMPILQDYNIGDTIGIEFQGEKYKGQVTRMEYSVSYGEEKIIPTVGIISKGTFRGILSNVSDLNNKVNKASNEEAA